MPHWTDLRLQLVNARNSGLPQNRPPAMIYSHCKVYDEVVGGMPEDPVVLPEPDLEDFLAAVADLKMIKRLTDHTDLQQQNLDRFNHRFEEMIIQQGFSSDQDVYAIVDASSKGSVGSYKSSIAMNYCPTLTTKNSPLFLLHSGPDMTKVPEGGRALHIEERARFSGVVWDSVKNFPEPSINMGLGNMMPVDLAAFVLAPIMQKWAIFEQRVIDLGLRNLYWLPFETCTDNGIVDADSDEDNGRAPETPPTSG